MSRSRIVFTGIEEFRAALRQLPEELASEGSHIVQENANAAEAEIKAGYSQHVFSGNLMDHLYQVTRGSGAFGTAIVIRNTAKHAWLFENGSDARHYVTVKGTRHETGKMPPFHVFIPAMIRCRRRMYEELAGLMRDHGLRVSGEA